MGGSNLTRRQAIGLGAVGAICAAGAGFIGIRHVGTGSVREAAAEEEVRAYILRTLDSRLVPKASSLRPCDLDYGDSYVRCRALVCEDGDVREGVTIDDVWEDGLDDAILGQIECAMPLYDVGDEHYLVALPWQRRAGGDTTEILDVQFGHDGLDGRLAKGCRLDFESGVAYVPRNLVEGDDAGVICQMLVSVPDAACTVEVPWRVIVGGKVRDEGVLECGWYEDMVAIPVGDLPEGVTKGDVKVYVDGMDEPFDGVATDAVGFGGGCVIVGVAPLLVAGVTVEIPASSPLAAMMPRVALAAVSSAGMTMWKYGNVVYDDELGAFLDGSDGRRQRFTFKGRFFKFLSADVGAGKYKIKSYYTDVRTYLYAWHATRSMSVRDPYDSNKAWDAINDYVYAAPGIQKKVTSWRDSTITVSGKSFDIRYFGQLLTLPGAARTSDYTFKDASWWSTLGGPTKNLPSGVTQGTIPGMCYHTSQTAYPKGFKEAGSDWLTLTLKCRVLDYAKPTPTSDGWMVLSVHTDEKASPKSSLLYKPRSDSSKKTIAAQGAGVIIRIPIKGTGALEVSKSLVDAGGNEVASSDAGASYRVRITLKKGNKAVSGVYDGVRFDANGVATIELAAGESKVISGLPAGTTYKVVELPSSGTSVSYQGKSSGTIKSMVTSEVGIINTEMLGECPVTIRKTVEGDDSGDMSFPIVIGLVDADDEPVSGQHGDVTFEDGVGHASVSANVPIRITSVPVGSTMRVIEVDVSPYVLSGISVDGDDAEVTEMTIDGFGQGIEVLVDHPVDVEITNRLPRYGFIEVSKVVADLYANVPETPGWVGKFDMTVTAIDADGNPIDGVFDEDSYLVTSDVTADPVATSVEFVGGEAHFELADGESMHVGMLPEGTVVSVVEQEYAGYESEVERSWGEGESAVIDQDEPRYVTFVNTRIVYDFDLVKIGDPIGGE